MEWAGNKVVGWCDGVEVDDAAGEVAFGVPEAPGFEKRADHDFGAVFAVGGGLGGKVATGSVCTVRTAAGGSTAATGCSSTMGTGGCSTTTGDSPVSCEVLTAWTDAEVLVDSGEFGAGVSVAGVTAFAVVVTDSAELEGGGGKKGVASSMI